MPWRALQSSHLNGADYDPETGALSIQFTNGAVYASSRPVPQTVVDTLFQYPSPGTYYHNNLKDRYGMYKVMDGVTKSGRRSRRQW